MTERVYRLFGVTEDTVRERLQDVLAASSLSASLSIAELEGCLQLSGTDEETLAWACEAVVSRLGVYIVATEDTSLEERVVTLLMERGKSVATAESCTGGLLASRLTAVSGASQVFGTGVVSYSWDCKKRLLGVAPQTLETYGAVSDQTAREMANGVRQRADADLGIGITGEAGPTAAEEQPVGTVFVALADKRRCWVKELHLDGDRAAVRRMATAYALDMVRRYLEAYPTVMAGGERHMDYADRHRQTQLPDTRGQRFMTAVLPWRGSRRLRIFKVLTLIAAAAVLVGSILLVNNYLIAPANNRELQGDLAQMYWDTTTDLTVEKPETDGYPVGMNAQFRGLYDLNDDIAGWVRIPDTVLNYPVTFYANGYYDNHSFNDQYSVYGQPYLDEMNTRDTLATDKVLAIHGNNTRDGQMFSPLLSYRRIAYLQEHSRIEMNTLYADAGWEIFAVAVVDERERATTFDYLRREFESDAAYEAYLFELQRRSLFVTDKKPTAEDTVLLLVTDAAREYGFSGAQLVVAACRADATEQNAVYTHNVSIKWPAAYARRTTTRTSPKTQTTSTTSTTTTTLPTDFPSDTTTTNTPLVTDLPSDRTTTTMTTTATVTAPDTTTTVPMETTTSSSAPTTTSVRSEPTSATTTIPITGGDADNEDRENTDYDDLGD